MDRLVRVFTHPACQGCGEAVKMSWELSQATSGVQLRTVALETKAGLAEAQREGIKTIPTIIVSQGDREMHRFVGSPSRSELELAVLGNEPQEA